MASIVIESDGVTLFNQPIGSYGPFRLQGGQYGVSSGAGTVNLQKVMSDGTTANVFATPVAANSYSAVNLSPGMYNVVIAGATSDAGVSRIKFA
jgi:hypothetical protein